MEAIGRLAGGKGVGFGIDLGSSPGSGTYQMCILSQCCLSEVQFPHP